MLCQTFPESGAVQIDGVTRQIGHTHLFLIYIGAVGRLCPVSFRVIGLAGQLCQYQCFCSGFSKSVFQRPCGLYQCAAACIRDGNTQRFVLIYGDEREIRAFIESVLRRTVVQKPVKRPCFRAIVIKSARIGKTASVIGKIGIDFPALTGFRRIPQQIAVLPEINCAVVIRLQFRIFHKNSTGTAVRCHMCHIHLFSVGIPQLEIQSGTGGMEQGAVFRQQYLPVRTIGAYPDDMTAVREQIVHPSVQHIDGFRRIIGQLYSIRAILSGFPQGRFRTGKIFLPVVDPTVPISCHVSALQNVGRNKSHDIRPLRHGDKRFCFLRRRDRLLGFRRECFRQSFRYIGFRCTSGQTYQHQQKNPYHFHSVSHLSTVV